MNSKNTILIALLTVVVFAMAGCSESHQTAGAERRWQRVLEEAQMEAAQESIEQGRLHYAIYLLEELVESDSAFADEAREMLIHLRAVAQEFAQARAVTDDLRQSVMY